MQATFLVVGAVFVAVGVAISVGGDVALWGSFLVLGLVFLTLGLVLGEDGPRFGSTDDGDDTGPDRRV